jgi:acetylornithine deacetylase
LGYYQYRDSKFRINATSTAQALMKLTPEIMDDLVNQVDESSLVKNLATMVSVPSVNPFDDPATASCRELEFANLYEVFLRECNMETTQRIVVESRPNVFGRIRGTGSGPCVMLAGHMDTVGIDGYDDPFNPVVKNRRVYGRGSCDMKAALAAYIEVARIIQKSNLDLSGDLLIAGVADEEHQMLGSKEISVNGPIPDFAIVGEPTELKVCHAHKGQLCMHIKTFGKASHSSVPESGVNAIQHMANVIQALESYGKELQSRPADPVCGHGRVNPGVIQGGTISSSVPDYCELEVDRRILAGESLESVVDEYRKLLEPLEKSIPDFQYEIGAPTMNNAALNTPADSSVVCAIAEAFEAIQGYPADVGDFTASTDAPHFLCPAVICGPGSIRQAHTLDEYVEIDQLTAAARIYLRTVLQLIA